jgi:hypothetical protein
LRQSKRSFAPGRDKGRPALLSRICCARSFSLKGVRASGSPRLLCGGHGGRAPASAGRRDPRPAANTRRSTSARVLRFPHPALPESPLRQRGLQWWRHRSRVQRGPGSLQLYPAALTMHACRFARHCLDWGKKRRARRVQGRSGFRSEHEREQLPLSRCEQEPRRLARQHWDTPRCPVVSA